LSFTTTLETPSQKSTEPHTETAIPAGLPFRLALVDDIHVASAAAGDTVKAVLTGGLRDQSKKVLLPKGGIAAQSREF